MPPEHEEPSETPHPGEGDHPAEPAGGDGHGGGGHAGHSDPEVARAVALAEAGAADAEAAHDVVEAAEHGRWEGVIGQAVKGGATIAEHALHAIDIPEETAEDVQAALAVVSAVAEAAVAAGRTVRGVAHMQHGRGGHGGGGESAGGHGAGAHGTAQDGAHAGATHAEVHEARATHAASAHDQNEVVLGIETDADPDHLLRVAAIDLEERLSDVYVARVAVLAEVRWNEAPFVLPADLLGTDVTLTITRGDQVRTIHGIVRRVEDGGTSSTHTTMRLEIVPAMALLAQQTDSRIFWQLSALEVIDAVLGAGLAPYDRELEINETIERGAREYCVQYQESDLAFVHRLMEEEGLTYFFDQSGEREKVVVVELNEQLHDHLDFLPITDVHGRAERDAITAMSETRRVTPTGLQIADFDWRDTVIRPISVGGDDPNDAHGRARPVYDHARALDLGPQLGQHDGERQLRLRRELVQRDAVVAAGRGTAMSLSAGLVFATRDMRALATLDDRTWVITSVRHRASDPRVQAIIGSDEGAPRYENQFECLPFEIPYRPSRRMTKPRIYGMQTGVVVGPEGQPVYSDEHRRVRVRFHWDRFRPNDTYGLQDPDRHTCWLRVSQSWAGMGYGTLFLPRVGMEVVVSFLDGDPDRPIVVGCVYSAANPPPYQSEEEWTVSTLKTMTIDGGDVGPGFNELRFEDRKGAEQVYVHAERDLDEVVERNHATHVKSCQRNVVDVDQHERIERDQWLRVNRHREKIVEGNECVDVLGDRRTHIHAHSDDRVSRESKLWVGECRQVRVEMKNTETYHGGREVNVDEFDNTIVKANKNTRVTGQYNVKADEHFHVEQGQQMVHLADSHVHIESDGAIAIVRPDASVRLGAEGIQIATEGTLILRGGGCEIMLHDGRVTIRGRDEAKMACGESVVRVGQAFGEITAGNVSIDALQVASVQGGTLVRIN